MKEIPLTQGKVAFVDDDIYDYINQWKWHVHAGSSGGRWYAKHSYWFDSSHTRMCHLRMQNVVMCQLYGSIPNGCVVDHIDCDGLNNQSCNLRFANYSCSMANRRKLASCSSSFKGVTFNKTHGRYMSRVCVNRKSFYLGYFVNEIDAAKAYDKAAKKYFGEYARLNFP